MRADYDKKPAVLEAVGNGSYLYRFNIEEVIPEVTEDENEMRASRFECDEVTVWPPLSANKITEAVITEMWPINYEQKLVNDYNAAVMGIYGGEIREAKIRAYTDYLRERDAIKAQIDADCVSLGIK